MNNHDRDTQNDFADGFKSDDFERLKADPDELREAHARDDDIGNVWVEQDKISRAEKLKQQARDAYGKALPAWRRGMYKTAHFLHEAATKDEPDKDPAPPTPSSDPDLAKSLSSRLKTKSKDPAHKAIKISSSENPETIQTDQNAGNAGKTTTVEIKLSMPKIPTIPKERIPTREQAIRYVKETYAKTPKRIKLTAAGVIASLLLAISVYAIITGAVKSDPTIADANNPSKAALMQNAKLKKETPKFRTMIPAGQNIERLGGWTRISPPDRDAVYAYADKIGAANISVSQQEIPPKNKKDAKGFVAELAAGYKATQRVHTEDTAIYIARSQDESQTVMFTKQDLLFFIRSSSAVTEDQWIGYVSSLQ